MCIALIAYKYHRDYPLIILSNRDEFQNRPTICAHFWTEYPHILAAKDMEQGGTWFGINKNGRIALLTNFRGPGEMDPKKKTRGFLVIDFLKQNTPPSTYLRELRHTARLYNGYNLIFGDLEQILFYNNVKEIIKRLDTGIHVLSNGVLDEMWPKCIRLKKLFLESISTCSPISINSLFNILTDKKRFPDHQLPDTGVGLDKERFLSPIFIKDPTYGTRTSTILTIDHQRAVRFIERTYQPARDDIWEQREFSFIIGQPTTII